MTATASARPLSILQVLEPSGGGSGRHFVDLCGELAKAGHRVVAIFSPTRAEARFVAELHALPLAAIVAVPMQRAPSPSDLVAWRAIAKVASEHGPFDIIHGHSSKAGALTRLRLPGRHVPRVYTPHAFRTMDPTLGLAGRTLFGTIETFLGRMFTDAVICVSGDEAEHARSTLGLPPACIHTIVNGVAAPPSGRKAEMRQRLGLGADSFVYGFVGRLSPQKAPERLIGAFARMARSHPDVALAMIGAGELEADVEMHIAKAGLGGRVARGTAVSGAEAMQAFDVLVMPSRYEAMSYVMLEAAAAGLPMILTDVGGARTVVDDGVNGFIIANSDEVGALAGRMADIHEPACHASMRNAAATRASLFGLNSMVARTEDLYRQLAER